ncbi:MAG: hypothetical protein HC794_07890 [Nitrospiraceae bacterium]|nr:hypothetical protein [Nitrospiraceae bacterium]
MGKFDRFSWNAEVAQREDDVPNGQDRTFVGYRTNVFADTADLTGDVGRLRVGLEFDSGDGGRVSGRVADGAELLHRQPGDQCQRNQYRDDPHARFSRSV